ADYERMQEDVVSWPARRFLAVLRRWGSEDAAVRKMLKWDASLAADSAEAVIYEVWIGKLPAAVFGPQLGARTDLTRLLETLESDPHPKALQETLEATLQQLTKEQGPDMDGWQWGRLHQIDFQHPLKGAEL